MPNPVLLFHRDGYVVRRADLKGRHAAGNAYLRAHVAALAGEEVLATGPAGEAAAFSDLVAGIDPAARARWIGSADLDGLAGAGLLSLPGPGLGEAAYLRLRRNPAAWSLLGITHTTASHGVMDDLCDLLHAPVMPWDALVCTSASVLDTVEAVFADMRDYLAWRHGGTPPAGPQLRVIPLGVHAGDFEAGLPERKSARAALGIGPEETVLLFVGRLSFHAKANPFALYRAAEAAARATRQPLVLHQCGWFANEGISGVFRAGASAWCPSVRALFSDGRDPATLRAAWASADVFVSLSDNVQETFGLTPLEAMAAGLPCIVTDWDGYRDTVRDGIDGVRLPTSMPREGFSGSAALDHEAGAISYDIYIGRLSQAASVPHAGLVHAIVEFVQDPARRRAMGQAGQERARLVFDWSVVMASHRALWQEMDDLRRSSGSVACPVAAAPGRGDPGRLFASYPTASLGPGSRVARDSAGPDLARIAADGLFPAALAVLPDQWPRARALLAVMPAGRPARIVDLAEAAGESPADAVLLAALLLKAGVLRLP